MKYDKKPQNNVVRAIADPVFRHSVPNMDVVRLFLCQLHIAPLLQDKMRDRWFTDMHQMLFDWMSRDSATVKAVRVAQGDAEELRQESLLKILDKVPACCRVALKDPEALKRIYIRLGIHRVARCGRCMQITAGTPIVTQEEKHPHVCYHCLTHNIDLERVRAEMETGKPQRMH